MSTSEHKPKRALPANPVARYALAKTSRVLVKLQIKATAPFLTRRRLFGLLGNSRAVRWYAEAYRSELNQWFSDTDFIDHLIDRYAPAKAKAAMEAEEELTSSLVSADPQIIIQHHRLGVHTTRFVYDRLDKLIRIANSPARYEAKLHRLKVRPPQRYEMIAADRNCLAKASRFLREGYSAITSIDGADDEGSSTINANIFRFASMVGVPIVFIHYVLLDDGSVRILHKRFDPLHDPARNADAFVAFLRSLDPAYEAFRLVSPSSAET